MPEALKSVSAEAVPMPIGESSMSFPEAETAGSAGSESAPSAQAEDLIVTGRRREPLPLPVRRVGAETVIGTDDRVRITDTDKYPWRMIAALRLIPKPPFSSTFIGTGWFIGPRTLLTAGHCVYSDSDFGGWIGRVEVSPGRNGDKFPFGTVNATRFATLERWQSTGDPDFDVGCIHLDQPVGETVGYLKLAAKSDQELADRMLNVAGYPGDRGNGTQLYHHANRILHVAARRIYYDIDTFGGQSGGLVSCQDSPADEPVAVGIHAYGIGGTPSNLGITANSAPRLTPELLETIRGWLAEADG